MSNKRGGKPNNKNACKPSTEVKKSRNFKCTDEQWEAMHKEADTKLQSK